VKTGVRVDFSCVLTAKGREAIKEANRLRPTLAGGVMKFAVAGDAPGVWAGSSVHRSDFSVPLPLTAATGHPCALDPATTMGNKGDGGN